MNILGLSFDYHDSAAAILKDGAVVAASLEERFSRRKHDASFPVHAAKFCLEESGLAARDLDQVVFYERPLLKLDRILRSSLRWNFTGLGRFREVLVRWLAEDRLNVRGRIREALDVAPERVVFVDHHQSHAASAFFCSDFDEAAIVTVDGVGEHETASISIGRDTTITKLASVRFPHSLGLFYSGFTAFLGFEINEGEYKVMGMSGFGQPRFADELLKVFDFHDSGTFRMNQRFFDFTRSDAAPFLPALIERLGPPRSPEQTFDPSGKGPENERARHYADVAASIQKCTEEVVLKMASRALTLTGERNLCLAGGVALNSVANGRIQRELGCPVYVHPAAGDAGGALGAAQYYHHCVLGEKRAAPLLNPYLGKSFSREEVLQAVRLTGMPHKVFDRREELLDNVIQVLVGNGVVGWFHGKAEWGPRALGGRSILASPMSPDMQRILNEKVKFREPFRPFAPSVLKERAAEFFDVADMSSDLSPEHFMLSIGAVRPDRRSQVPAITHVDGTARIHLVARSINPTYYDLIEGFGRRTSVPVLLNTSFNLSGEPIVNSPEDALSSFSYSNMDCLAFENCVVYRR